jgi:hypothetical protein
VAVPVRVETLPNETDTIAVAEVQIAIAERVGVGRSSGVLYPLSANSSLPEFMAAMSKYDIKRVIFDEYADILGWTVSERQEFKSALAAHRVESMPKAVSVGLVMSSNTRDVAMARSSAYTQAVCDLGAGVVRRLGHKLVVFFDSDLDEISERVDDSDRFYSVRTLLMVDVQNMSGDAITGLQTLLEREDKQVVSIGLVGYYVDRGVATRTPPMWAMFDATYLSQSAVNDTIDVNSNCPIYSGTQFAAENWIAQAASGFDSGFDDPFALLTDGRSFVIGTDLYIGSDTREFLLDLVDYSAAR